MEEEEKKNLEIQVMYKDREIEKDVETVKEHEHKIEAYNKAIGLAREEYEIKKEVFKKQIENFAFSEHYKPTEKWLMSDEYEGYAKSLQEVVAEKQLMDIQETIRTQERFIRKSEEDKEAIMKRLPILKIEKEELEKQLKGE